MLTLFVLLSCNISRAETQSVTTIISNVSASASSGGVESRGEKVQGTNNASVNVRTVINGEETIDSYHTESTSSNPVFTRYENTITQTGTDTQSNTINVVHASSSVVVPATNTSISDAPIHGRLFDDAIRNSHSEFLNAVIFKYIAPLWTHIFF